MSAPLLPAHAHPLARLRAITDDDLPGWLAILRSDPVKAGISWRPHDIADLLQFVGQTDLRTAPGQVRFAIARRDDDRLLGSIGLHTISLPHRSAEIAYDVDPAHWGQGLASAACRAVLAWARECGLWRIQATVLSGNAASAHVLTRCGFVEEGVLRGYRQVDGQARDAVMFSSVPMTKVPA